MLGFATSAVRDARNCDAVLDHVADETGVRIAVLPGDDEARLTFLAVRRWFGWSAGRLAVFDIGGGSLEIAGGSDEEPDVAWSIPIGAARLAREHFRDGSPGRRRDPRPAQEDPRRHRPGRRAPAARRTARPGGRDVEDVPLAGPDLWRGTLRATARSSAARSRSASCSSGSRSWSTWASTSSAALPGVSPSRTHQIVPGALVAEAVMDIFDLEELQICPWALREGVILERLDQLADRGTA